MERRAAAWYRDFRPPPEAKVYYPTDAEFRDPIEYVQSIKAEAERYGVIRVVPPRSFRPPFVIEPRTFRFQTRTQPLYGIDALCRSRVFLIHELRTFWKNAGKDFQWPYISDHYIDFYRLRHMVAENGGVEESTRRRKWADFAYDLGFNRTDGPTIRDSYVKWFEPFEEHWKHCEDELKKEEEMEIDVKPVDVKPTPPARPSLRQTASRMSAQRNSRMMAGVSTKKPALRQKKPAQFSHICLKCGKAVQERDQYVSCSECSQEFHKACLSRMVSNRSNADWRCVACLMASAKEVDFFFQDNVERQTLAEFTEKANAFKKHQFDDRKISDIPIEEIERRYWQHVGDFDTKMKVEYGADILSSEISSGFPRTTDDNGKLTEERMRYAKHPWNLNNLPVLDKSVLGHVGTEISGMMIPWVYVGMCFSTFCWHVEDHWTYSMNFLHHGETKVWYGMPGEEADKFDELMKREFPGLFSRTPDLLHHMTTMVNPMFLQANGIKIYTVRQNAGEFVITFPRSYHAGFNAGLNVAEAVNFAPHDWLEVGRHCVDSYKKDMRRCVFAHDELVLRIAQTEQRLDVRTSKAVVRELKNIRDREQAFRSGLLDARITNSEPCDFENLDDDRRSCAVCRTTLFITALHCAHEDKGMACARHWQQLLEEVCNKCKPADCTIKYRYSLKQISDFGDRVKQKVTVTEVWADRVRKGLSTFIPLTHAKLLLDEWAEEVLLQCPEKQMLDDAIAASKQFIVAAKRPLQPAVRLRDDTRFQRADDRMTIADLIQLIDNIRRQPVRDVVVLQNLEELLTKVRTWLKQVDAILRTTRVNQLTENVVGRCEALGREGEEFNLRLEQLRSLRKVTNERQCELLQITEYNLWCAKVVEYINKQKKSQNAAKVLSAAPTAAPSSSPASSAESLFDDDSRITFEDMNDLVRRGEELVRYRHDAKDFLSQLKQLRSMSASREAQVSVFMERAAKSAVTFEEVISMRRNAAEVDFLSTAVLDDFRVEYDRAENANRIFLSLEKQDEFYYESVDVALSAYQKSKLLANCQASTVMKNFRATLSEFTKKVNSVFLKDHSYFSTFEVLAGREDIPSLIEGGPEALYRQAIAEGGYDDWTELRRFRTEEEMCSHINQLHQEQRRLLIALRHRNQRCTAAETCVKAPSCSNTTAAGEPFVECYLCCAKDHVRCAPWDENIRALYATPGLYLCVRCFRSKRPTVEVVQSLKGEAPVSTREATLLHICTSKAIHIMNRLKKNLHSVSENELNPLHIALSLEIHDPELMQELLPRFISADTFTATQIRNVEEVANNNQLPPVVVNGFDEAPRRKRTRISRQSPTKRRQISEDHDDDENYVCGAPNCMLQKAASKLRWVMCEAGCGRWFHYVCVNLNVITAQQMAHYECSACVAPRNGALTGIQNGTAAPRVISQ